MHTHMQTHTQTDHGPFCPKSWRSGVSEITAVAPLGSSAKYPAVVGSRQVGRWTSRCSSLHPLCANSFRLKYAFLFRDRKEREGCLLV